MCKGYTSIIIIISLREKGICIFRKFMINIHVYIKYNDTGHDCNYIKEVLIIKIY